MRRRIAVVTGSRADFGLLSRVIAGLLAAPDVECQVVVTGAHLSATHGMTVREIEAAGVPVAWRVPLDLSGDSPADTVRAMGQAVSGFAAAFERLAPEVIVVLGDRYEILAAASAAVVMCIPVAHLHGGEISAGAVDDAIRHAITKLSQLHFVAAEPYRRRVVQMGETPAHVHLVGGLGVDLARATPRLDREAFTRDTGYEFGPRNLVVTFHPVTLDAAQGEAELQALLDALATLEKTHLAFTLPNADVGNAAIRSRIEAFVAARTTAWAFSSLGFRRYLSLVALSDGVVGNSSSGLIEAPALGIGTVNVGRRQDGRLRASSVIDCAPNEDEIRAALEQLLSEHFRAGLRQVVNPYGNGGAADRVVSVLRTVPLAGLTTKDFHDVPAGALALTADD
jgi:GDP/UDP-N,N'-diacetylbacillosamine 2-epimerase (hydrolysing)